MRRPLARLLATWSLGGPFFRGRTPTPSGQRPPPGSVSTWRGRRPPSPDRPAVRGWRSPRWSGRRGRRPLARRLATRSRADPSSAEERRLLRGDDLVRVPGAEPPARAQRRAAACASRRATGSSRRRRPRCLRGPSRASSARPATGDVVRGCPFFRGRTKAHARRRLRPRPGREDADPRAATGRGLRFATRYGRYSGSSTSSGIKPAGSGRSRGRRYQCRTFCASVK